MSENKSKILGAPMMYDDISVSDRQSVRHALEHGASRREVMGWLMAAGATIASAGSIVSGAGQAIAATPKSGGTLRHSGTLHGPSDTLDPTKFTSGIDYVRGRAHYNSLIRLADNLEPMPELAESFEANADASEWVFKIRKGVKFHDGSPLTADDVLYSLNRHMGKDSTSNAKAYLTAVKEWKKTDSHTVKAIMNFPNADLAALMGVYQFKIIKDGTKDFANPVGTGPFKLVEFKPGIRSVHMRNEDYWTKPANLERLEIFAITDPVARVNALLAGDIAMMESLEPKAIPQVEGNDNVEVMSTPSNQYNGICCMKNQAPGSSNDFVLGMKYLLKRDRVVKQILKGHGVVGNDHPISSAYPEHCSDLAQREHDPDKAKFHFKKSGVSGVEVYTAPVNPGLEDTVLMLQREAQKVGFNLKVKKVPADGYWGAIWLKKPVNVVVWNMRPTAHAMLSVAFAPDAPWNDTKWVNPRMGKLLKMSSGELDKTKRNEMFCEMQTLIHNEGGWVIPSHVNYVDAKQKKVKGIGKSPLGNCGGYEWPEFAWLDT